MPLEVDAEVISNTKLSADYNVVALAAPGIAAGAGPGQFVMVKASHDLTPLLRRPFSIFERLTDQRGEPRGITLLNKRVGPGTSRLYDVAPGDTMSVLGPLGRPFAPVEPPCEAWMVAGGVGLAPFATLAETLVRLGVRTRLFYGGRSAGDLYYESLFEHLGVSLTLTTEDGSRGERGRITLPLARDLEAAAGRPVTLYACGPTPMMQAVADLGARLAQPVFVSLEPVMGCGLGGCYSCVVPVRRGPTNHFVRACIEGPVFDAATVAWSHLGHP